MPQKLSATRKEQLKARSAKTRRPIEPVHPDLIGVSYSKRLQGEIERGFLLVESLLFPVLKNDVERLDSVRIDITEDADIIGKTINKILSRFFGGMFSKDHPNLTGYSSKVLNKLVSPMLAQTDRHNKTQFTKTFNRIAAVDSLENRPELNKHLRFSGEVNTDLIVTQNRKYFNDIQAIADRGLRKGSSVADMTQEIIDLTGTTQSNAKRIALDQVNKLNADLEGERQRNNGMTRYIWHTRKNARVRSKANSNGTSDHRSLEGAVFDWNFPPITVLKGKRAGETNHPGQDILCFCWAEPVIEDITGKRSKVLELAEFKTRKLINQGRVPGYKIPKAA